MITQSATKRNSIHFVVEEEDGEDMGRQIDGRGGSLERGHAGDSGNTSYSIGSSPCTLSFTRTPALICCDSFTCFLPFIIRQGLALFIPNTRRFTRR